jgi:hypothetical protein
MISVACPRCWQALRVAVLVAAGAAVWLPRSNGSGPEQEGKAPYARVRVGKASYAAGPPPEAPEPARKFAARDVNLVGNDDRPIPTNQWWTDLLVSKYARSLWAFPLKIDTGEHGLDVFFPTRWADAGNDPVSEHPLHVGGTGFKPADARARDWSDWRVVFRLAESPRKLLDVTLVRGMPYVWLECTGVQPTLDLGKGAGGKFFDRNGRPVALPAAADCLGIEYRGRCFGLFAPEGTRFTGDGERVQVAFAGPKQYLVLATMPAATDLDFFYRHAFALPRDTRLSYRHATPYLVRDPDFARACYRNMLRDYEAKEKKPGTIKQFGPALGSVMLGYVLMYDPAWVAEQLDTLWAEPGDKVAHEASEMAIMYYMAHAMRRLGRVDWTCHTSSPTSMVFIDPATKTRTYAVWNPRPTPTTVDVYERDKRIGQMTAAPQTLTAVTHLKQP